MTVLARNLTLRAHFGADRHPTLSLGSLYFALFNGDPLAAGVEPDASGGYARVAKSNDAALWGAIAAGATSVFNAGEVLWPAASGLYSVPSLTHWAIFDNSAGGALWYSGKLSTAIAVTGAGDVPRIPAGAFSVGV